MFSLSVGVYHRKLGGFAELAAATRLAVVTLLELKMLGLFAVDAKSAKGKWSCPRGHPSAQYACHVSPAA